MRIQTRWRVHPAAIPEDHNAEASDQAETDISAAQDWTISFRGSVGNADGTDVATADGVTLDDALPGDLTWTVTAITDGSKRGGLAVGDTVPGGVIDCDGIELAPGASFLVSVTAASPTRPAQRN